MMHLNEVMTQEIINRMNSYCESRERSAAHASERTNRNKQVQDLIQELSAGAE